MNRQDIEKIIQEVPELTSNGIANKSDSSFDESRERLLNSGAEIAKIANWLSGINKIKSINTHRSSYGMKHIAEIELGYISNGAFIAAAIYCGYKYKAYNNSPNVSFNMSERSIKQRVKNNGFIIT